MDEQKEINERMNKIIKELPLGAKVEISMIAYISTKK